MTEYEIIVVGSGATGAMAAQTLVEAGRRVALFDVGRRDQRYAAIIPDQPFTTSRRSDAAQHRYLLGEEFESIATLGVKVGAQLTPPRKFVIEDVARLLPIRSPSFQPLESLALGGLAGAWGLACAVFSPAELERASLDATAMSAAYDVIADRIGISGDRDDAQPYTFAHVKNVEPALPIDETAGQLLQAYYRRRESIRSRGFHVGRPALALLSRAKGTRRASTLDEMEFYSDAGRSAWRAWFTIEQLNSAAPRFTYHPDRLVLRFEEDATGITVFAQNTQDGTVERSRCGTLVLTAGALGSARIVLRSHGGATAAQLPLLCSPYTYLPCVVPRRLGRRMADANIALSQLALFYDPHGDQTDVTMAQVYSYRSLLMFRLLGDIPLPVREARRFLQFLLPGFVIAGIFHPHANEAGSTIALEPDAGSPTGDRLAIDFRLTPAETARVRERDAKFAGCLRQLGALPIKRVDPGLGSSIHYAGTLPISQVDRPLTTASDGRLHGTRRVFVADGSGFTYLPAKGLTLSIMARAHLVAKHIIESP